MTKFFGVLGLFLLGASCSTPQVARELSSTIAVNSVTVDTLKVSQRLSGNTSRIRFMRSDLGIPVVMVPFDRLRVTQSFVGRTLVKEKMVPLKLSKSPDEVQASLSRSPREGIIFRDTDGQLSVFHLDGHHRSLEALLYNEAKKAKVQFPVKLIDDYTGEFGGRKRSTLEEMAQDLFVVKGKGYVPQFKEPTKQLAFLMDPSRSTIGKVSDCLQRGTVGTALFDLKNERGDEAFDGDAFVDYFEFFLAERLSPSGLGCLDAGVEANLKRRGSFTSEVTDEVLRGIFATPGCSILRDLETIYIRPGFEQSAAASLVVSKETFDQRFPQLAGVCRLGK